MKFETPRERFFIPGLVNLPMGGGRGGSGPEFRNQKILAKKMFIKGVQKDAEGGGRGGQCRSSATKKTHLQKVCSI